MRILRQILTCLAISGCTDPDFGPHATPNRSFNVKGKVIEIMNECPRAGLVKIQLVPYSDTVCSYIANDSFRIPDAFIIFDMSKRTGQTRLAGCQDSLPELVALFNLRFPEEE